LQNSRIHTNPPRWAIAIGIFYYLLTVNLVGLTHEHEHEHGHQCEHEHGHQHEHEHDPSSSEHCSACFFIANHIGIAFHVVDFTTFNTGLPISLPFELTFSSTKPANNIRSRAPPASSVSSTL
jgi:hypothetical protein